jgi:hypothetical protein
MPNAFSIIYLFEEQEKLNERQSIAAETQG